MKQVRAGQAASTPQAIDEETWRRAARFLAFADRVHKLIAQDLEDDLSMCAPDVPPDPDDALIEWVKQLNAASVLVEDMPTLGEAPAFYAEETTREPALR